MNLDLESIYYASRSFVFGCAYEELLAHCFVHSTPNPTIHLSAQMRAFVEGYMSKFDVSQSKAVAKFDELISNGHSGAEAQKICLNADVSVFVLRQKEWRESLNSASTIGSLRKRWLEALNFLQEIIVMDTSVFFEAPSVYKQLPRTEGVRTDAIKAGVATLENNVKLWKARLFEAAPHLEPSVLTNLSYRFEEFDKRFQDVSDYFEVLDKISFKPVIILSVARSGAANLAVVYQKNPEHINLTEGDYDKNENNPLAKLGASHARIISSAVNSTPKFFSFIDLNSWLGFQDFSPIYDWPCKVIRKEDDEASKALHAQFSTSKAAFLRFVVPSMKHDGAEDRRPMIFFDYVSMLAAYFHAFDPYLIWQYVNHKTKDPEPKERIKDWLNKVTEHLYFDDMTAVVSVTNPSANASALTKLTGSSNMMMHVSHEARIYAFWDYIYACTAMSFSSMSNLLMHLYARASLRVEKGSTKWLRRAHLNRYLARSRSQIEQVFNDSLYGTKSDAIPVNSAIFECTGFAINSFGIKEIANNQVDSIKADEEWNKSLLGLFFTVISLAITLLAFGMIAKVYIEGAYAAGEDYVGHGYDGSVPSLLWGIVTTWKFWMLLVFVILIAGAFFAYGCITNRWIRTKTLPQFCGLGPRKKKNKIVCKHKTVKKG